ncbi:MAG TPA: DUF4388 domain-containing protein [Blastocatellia bacterium]|nr:DUF4388 domain-containing protein [Blastocatellia bacterium]
MTHSKDRREAKRISYLCEVECEGDGIARTATRINDISMTGAFIDSMAVYSPGTRITLRFRVKDLPIETTAEVRYSIPQMGMGVQFLDLKPRHLAALESLIENKPLVLPPGDEPEPDTVQSNAPDLLRGNFAIVSMFDIIQMIENNKLGGSLSVKSPAAIGEIFFNDGQIVGAQSGAGSGINALKSFLDITEGSFEFKRSDADYSRTIEAISNMSLMLDLLRVKDEEAALSQQ